MRVPFTSFHEESPVRGYSRRHLCHHLKFWWRELWGKGKRLMCCWFRISYVVTFIVMSFNWIGELEEVIFEARLMRKLDTSDFSEDAEFINGLQSHEVEIQRHVPLHKAKVWIRRSKDKKTLVISAIEIPYSCALFQRESTLPWLCWPTEKDE